MGTAQKSGTPAGARALALARSELGLTSIVAMAVVGIAIAGYLTAVHYAKVPLACPTTGVINCQAVTSSAYSVVPGTSIPITVPGILWFAASGALAAIALVRIWQGRPELANLRLAQLLWGVAGLVFVLYLVYAEIVVLHKLCEWCTVVHLLTLGTLLVAVKCWQDGQVGSGSVSARQLSRQPQGAESRGASATRASGQPGVRRHTSGRGR
jgi:uncharacterized membrane protein